MTRKILSECRGNYFWYGLILVPLSPDKPSLLNSADPDLHPDFHSAYGFTLFSLMEPCNLAGWNFEMGQWAWHFFIVLQGCSSYSENWSAPFPLCSCQKLYLTPYILIRVTLSIIYLMVHRLKYQDYDLFQSPKFVFILVTRADPDEMLFGISTVHFQSFLLQDLTFNPLQPAKVITLLGWWWCKCQRHFNILPCVTLNAYNFSFIHASYIY